MNITRSLMPASVMVANVPFPVSNVTSRGIPLDTRLDSLVLDFDVEISGSIGVNFALNPSNLFSLLDGLCSSIRLFSSPLGDVIGRMSLGQLVRTWLPLGVRITGIETWLAGTDANPTTCRFQVEIPYNLPFINIKGLHAPQAYQFPDGGLEFTPGPLTFSAIDGSGIVTMNVAGAVAAYWVGRRMGVKLKSSPLITEYVSASDRSRTVDGAGRHFSLVQLTDNVNNLSRLPGNPSGASVAASGIELRGDGKAIYTGNEFNPAVALAEVRNNCPNSLVNLLSTLSVDNVIAVGTYTPAISPLSDAPFVPILFPPDFTSAPDRLPTANKLNIIYQDGYTSPYNEGHVYVRPTSAVGDVDGCNCVGPAVVPGAVYGSVANADDPFMPALIG